MAVRSQSWLSEKNFPRGASLRSDKESARRVVVRVRMSSEPTLTHDHSNSTARLIAGARGLNTANPVPKMAHVDFRPQAHGRARGTLSHFPRCLARAGPSRLGRTVWSR